MAYLIERKYEDGWGVALPKRFEDLEEAESVACELYDEYKGEIRVVDERYRECDTSAISHR